MPGVEDLDTIKEIKEISECSELYHVTEYEGYRKHPDGTPRKVIIRVLDGGPDQGELRYHVSAKRDDGTGASGNAGSLDTALRMVHWGYLDR